MTPTQNFENYPEFANAGQKSQPNDAKYAAGFVPSDVLPAEWLNWFLNGATKGVTALNTGVKSIEKEINTVLESRSVKPDINAVGQLLSVLNKIKAEAVLAAHPVGSLYWTSKNENPSITFGGGTWKQITDKFVLNEFSFAQLKRTYAYIHAFWYGVRSYSLFYSKRNSIRFYSRCCCTLEKQGRW